MVVIRDLGTTNGTAVNEVVLRNAERVLLDGDRITIGSLAFTARIAAERGARDLIDDLVVSWLVEDSGPESDADNESMPSRRVRGPGPLRRGRGGAGGIPAPLRGGPGRPHRHPPGRAARRGRLDRPPAAGPVRAGPASPLPRRVVLDLSQVSHVSSRGVGVLLAHYLRLDRLGGSLRLCRLNDRLLSLLKQIRLPMVLETYAGIDEAVLTSWS